MIEFFDSSAKLVGHSGSILLPDDDEITRKLAMLFEGQCEGLGPTQAARKFGYTKQRYFQLLEQFEAQGALALQSKARGPKTNYRRTEELVRQIIRHRFLDPDASAEVIAQKLQQAHHLLSIRSVERAVRQLRADKISGNQVGIWLLAPEHLRLGTWDLLCAWSQSGGQTIWPRMALHLVHEAAFCVNGLRNQRSLTQKGFELSNGLPFVPTDFAIHEMLGRHTMAEAQALQVALGKIRRASGHFQGRLLGIDPHRIKSCTKRQTRRHRFSAKEKALKMAQCFFCLDLDSAQPLCFTLASAARTVTQAQNSRSPPCGQIGRK